MIYRISFFIQNIFFRTIGVLVSNLKYRYSHTIQPSLHLARPKDLRLLFFFLVLLSIDSKQVHTHRSIIIIIIFSIFMFTQQRHSFILTVNRMVGRTISNHSHFIRTVKIRVRAYVLFIVALWWLLARAERRNVF